MLAIASTTVASATTEHALSASVTVQGRVCSTPALAFTPAGAAVAHFLLDCEDVRDPRVHRLTRPGTTVIDVTVWGTDAVFVADRQSALTHRYRCVKAARAALPVDHKQEAVVWDISAPLTLPVRRGARVRVDGTPRPGTWLVARGGDHLVPFGLLADALPRRLGGAITA